MADSSFAALDEQKFQAYHWRAVLTTGLGVFCDGYDISCIALVLPEALHSFGITNLTKMESGSPAHGRRPARLGRRRDDLRRDGPVRGASASMASPC